MQHQINSFNTSKLINSFLEGTLTEDENQELQNWLDADPQNELLFQNLKTDEYLKSELKLLHSFDEEKAFEKIRETITNQSQSLVIPLKKNHVRRMIWSAAAAIVFIAIPLSIIFLNTPKNLGKDIVQSNAIPEIPQERIAAGGNKAILTLSDGSVISLNDLENGVLTQEGNVDIVKLKDGQIAYGNAENATPEIHYNVITTPKGGKYNLTLSDGTKVWLNAASSLRFPASFSGKTRKVEMEGEVYFDIAEDLKHPFIVMVNGAEILVTGTEFNVNAYKDESTMKITLLEGNVSLKSSVNHTKLMAGQQAEISEGNFHVHKTVDLEDIIAWKEGLFHFNKADIKMVMKEIARWYDVEVEFKDAGKRRVFKGEMQRDLELSQVIKILNKHHIKVDLSGRKMIVSY
jgi:ferric-dicitrate binding protein FerR (iron transport regulator)